MLSRLKTCLLGLLLGSPLLFSSNIPTWPLQDVPSPDWSAYHEFVQPTATGDPDSALFGCFRNSGNRFHEAVDIAPVLPRKRGEATDPVVAVHDGVVKHINLYPGNSSYGRYVVLEHPGLNLDLYTLYAHLASVDDALSTGQSVKAGHQLGIMGRSAGGYTIPRSRAHLHLEVGLRLSDDFEQWYLRQGYNNPNDHGNFNGINLVGWNPLDYFEAYDEGEVKSPLSYLELIPPAVMVHVYSTRRPDFIERYPELVLPGTPDETIAGWEVLLSAWGLPLSFKPIGEGALKGVSTPGEISVVGVDRKALEAYACRRIVSEKNGKVVLDDGGQRILEILFMPDRSGD